MTSLRISKAALLKDLGRGASESLWERVTMMGTPIDEQTPEDIILDITPNRPDLLSRVGFTRALQAFLEQKPGLRLYRTTPSTLKVTVDESLKGIRPATACAVAKGLRIDEEVLKEIIDLQEKLHVTFGRRRKRCAIGVYPLDAISGNITFTAKAPSDIVFRPLDADKEMTATQILAEHPKGKEFAHLLEGLSKYPVFMDRKGNVLSMPPVINSHTVGKVTTSTTELFIEASGDDFRVCHEAVQMICCALADWGANIQTVQVMYGKRTEVTPDLNPHKQEFYGYYVEKRLGIHIKPEMYPVLLAKMGLGYEPGRIKDTHRAIIPPYRVDFLHQVDVIEDLAIAFGYENIPAILPNLATVGGESPKTILSRAVRKHLAGLGMLEAKNYHLTSTDLQKRLGETDIVTLRSSVSSEYDSLRKSLITSLLGTLAINKVHAYPQAFFEIGVAFSPQEHAVIESTRLAMMIAGDNGTDYTRARQLLENLFMGLGLQGTFVAYEDIRFLKGRCARVEVGGGAIGIVGELSPQTITEADLAVPIAAAEIDLTAILALLEK